MPQQGGQTAVWYDNEFIEWAAQVNGIYFTASTFYPGMGQISLQGQFDGYLVSYGIYDAMGNQVGYGQGSIDDDTHISVTSFWMTGQLIGSGQFHVNHTPN